jgi:hypothetical protein
MLLLLAIALTTLKTIVVLCTVRSKQIIVRGVPLPRSPDGLSINNQQFNQKTMESKETLAEQTLEGISKVLELYNKQKNGETIDDGKLEQFKEWFNRLVDYKI